MNDLHTRARTASRALAGKRTTSAAEASDTAPGAPQPFLRDVAYEQIKAMLFLNEETGRAYSERQLAAQFGLGLNPVRSAIERLKLEGLVVVVPKIGIMLPEMSANAINDFYEIRTVIESHVALSLVGQLQPSDIERVEAILRQQEDCVREGAYLDYHQLDMAFHLSLAQIHGNEEIVQMLERLRDKMHRLSTRLHTKYPGRLGANVQQHREIFEAIKDGDAKRAQNQMRAHLVWGKRFVLDPRSSADALLPAT